MSNKLFQEQFEKLYYKTVEILTDSLRQTALIRIFESSFLSFMNISNQYFSTTREIKRDRISC